MSSLPSCTDEIETDGKYNITINPENSQKLVLGDFCTSIELVPLQTTKESILGSSKKIELFNNRYYIHDITQQALFVFDLNGKFIFHTLNHRGNGPDQYSNLTDFNVNHRTNNIEILDAVNSEIKYYSLNGLFIGSLKYPSTIAAITSFEPISIDSYIFYSKFSYERKESLIFYSINDKAIQKAIMPLPEGLRKFTVTNKNAFYSINDSIYFSPTYPSNSNYKIDPKGCKLINNITLSFGERDFEYNKLLQNQPNEYYRNYISKNNKNIVFVFDIKENCDLILVYFYFDNKTHLIKYNKRNRTLKQAFNPTNDEGQFPICSMLDKSFLYYLCEPRWVKYVTSYDLLNNESKEIFKKINDSDNPILIKYTLKY